MSGGYVPGPFDEFRGIFEFDCTDYITPELKAKLRVGNFLPVQFPPEGCDLVVRPDSSKPDDNAPTT
jgi:hypothetical protein